MISKRCALALVAMTTIALGAATSANATVLVDTGVDGSYSATFVAGSTLTDISFGMWNPPSYTNINGISLTDAGGPNLLTQAWTLTPGPDYCCSGSGDDGSQAGYLSSGSFSPYTVFDQQVATTLGDTYTLNFTISNSYGYDQYAAASDALVGVPEPATWGLMLVGVGGLGAALRRRRAGVNAAFA
jgi:hypothetical protein